MKKKIFFMLAGVIIVLLAFSTYALSAVWYVKPGGSDSNSGNSWTDAFATIQQAITTASVGVDQIWVMEGNYNITSSIQINKLVAIYGGFPDSLPDPQWSDRNWQTNITTLDGNSASIKCIVVTSDATIDGFTITTGGLGYESEGGGVFNMNCNPTIRNCIFTGISEPMYGGALGNWNSSPIIENCTFIGNSAIIGGAISNRGNSDATINNCTFSGNNFGYDGGGAIFNDTSSPTITNCTFSENITDPGNGGAIYNLQSLPSITGCIFYSNSGGDGGAIFNVQSNPSITNCTFQANMASGTGGSIHNINSISNITNCTFYNNSADFEGGAIREEYSTDTITNCILWGNNASANAEVSDNGTNVSITVTYCDIQGGYSGTGNIDENPLFVNPASGDFHLQSDSPCIDVGNNSAAGIPSLDFEGDPRIVDGDNDLTATVDMGADEYLPDTTPPVITLLGANPLVIVLDSTYTDPGATAIDDVDGDLTTSIVVGGDTVDISTLGSYTVTYNVSDAAGNPAAQVTRTVNVVDTTPEDTTPPVITLVGANPLVIEFGASYTDPGATATDDVDGDLTASIVVGGDTVDISTLGSYTVTYNVSDAAGNPAAPVTRTVNVVDTTPPVITLIGNSTVTVEAGSTYTDAGATASDNYDGVITGSINPISTVDTSTLGSYTVTYYVSDSSGNSATPVIRTVNVLDTKAPSTSGYVPDQGTTCAAIDTNIVVHVMDTGSGVNENTIVMTVDTETVFMGNNPSTYPYTTITGGLSDFILTYNPPADFGYEQEVKVTVNASDLAVNPMDQKEYSFLTEPQGGCIDACQGDSDCDGILDVTETTKYYTDPNKRTLFVRPTKASGGYWNGFIDLFSQGADPGFANVPPFTDANIEISVIGASNNPYGPMTNFNYDPADPGQNPNNLPCDILEIVYKDGNDPDNNQQPYYCAEAGQNHNYGHTYFATTRTWYWDTKAYAIKLSDSTTKYGYHYFNIYPFALENYFSEGAYISIDEGIGPVTPSPCPLPLYKAGQCYDFGHSSPMNLDKYDPVGGKPDNTVEFNPIKFEWDKKIKKVEISETGYEKPKVLMRIIAHEMGHGILEGDQTLDHCTNSNCIMYGNSVDWEMHNFDGDSGNCQHKRDDIRKRIHNSKHY